MKDESLPVVPQTKSRYAANWIVHFFRVTLVGCLLFLLYRPPQIDSQITGSPSLDDVRTVISDAAAVDQSADSMGYWIVRSENGEILGRVTRTMPAAIGIRGYRGETEALIAIDSDDRITAVDILFSRDTREHVAAVREDQDFLKQFEGWKIDSAPNAQDIDGVSGATLTSLAMARGILSRLGETPASLVFPEPLTEQEQGQYIRTGPLVDNLTGYQGPTELLFAVSKSGVIEEIKLRSSFDNQPYVRYVVEDRYFWSLFENKTIDELAEFDLVEQQVEGVSGATMTSQAVARTIVAAADQLRQQAQADTQSQSESWRTLLAGWTFSSAEVGTILWIIGAGLLSFWGLQRRRRWRAAWLIATILVIGTWAGNLLSMSLLVGWSSAGTALTIAPGLAVLVGVALLGPPLTKSNTYCSHLCPHGAVQQLIRPQGFVDQNLLRRKPRRWQLRLKPRWQRVLKLVPGTTLVSAYLLALFRPETDLASWEPFHAYLYPIASIATIALFFASLAFSVAVPMGYCRFGCPTGSLLDYLRRNAHSHRVTWVDGLLVALLIAAALTRIY